MTADAGRPVAVVTGAAGGIGRAVADLLVLRGYEVAALDLAGPVDHPARAHLTPQRVDVTDEDDVRTVIDDVAARHGRIDALVTAAAVLECYAVHDTPLAAWDRLFAVNVTGTFLAAKACLPHLRRAPGASIVTLSSVHAYASVPRTAAYAATKGAIVALSRQMAVEYADDGIRVNTLVIGSVDTAMSTAHGAAIARDGLRVTAPTGALGRMAGPDEVAGAVAMLLSSDASFITGAAVQADGGLLNRLM